MTTLECVSEDASLDNGARVQLIAAELAEVFRSRQYPELADGVGNVVDAFEPARAEVALLGYYARIAESLQSS